MRKNILFFLIITILSFSLPLFADDIALGGAAGWNNIIRMNTCVKQKGESEIIRLSDSEYLLDESTEVLMHFDSSIRTLGGLYSVKDENVSGISTAVKKKGAGSAVFTGAGRDIQLIPSDNAAFAAGSGKLSDFTIEFWLNPARLSEGENIIQWMGALNNGHETVHQSINCSISRRCIVWSFSNFFLPPELSSTAFTLRSHRSLIPKRWHHHMIRYDSSTGLLEYLIDGQPEDIIYTNSSGHEAEDIYYPVIGASMPTFFIIGRGYTGYIDEVRISSAYRKPELDRYSIFSGTVMSRVFDLGYYDSRFTGINAKSNLTGNTQIYYFYRISDKLFTAEAETPEWIQFESGELNPPETKGRFLQIMAELYPDGAGIISPELSEIKIHYEKNLPPLPPAYITVEEQSNSIKLSWKPVTDSDVAGYKIYYGDRPGIYFGTDSIEGKSPIDVEKTLNFTLNGLTNGKLYYFSITAYDNAEIPHESTFSKEFSARPSAIIGDD
ncbi:MAG: fibronectin type III domain-containing protein [Spirochaetales bacterium]|nr:fibronectin type III domain-containing protein [Spirochaetales bacterium]